MNSFQGPSIREKAAVAELVVVVGSIVKVVVASDADSSVDIDVEVELEEAIFM
jgi:hypothetical protein